MFHIVRVKVQKAVLKKEIDLCYVTLLSCKSKQAMATVSSRV